MDRGAWWAAVGVAKSWTWLKWLSTQAWVNFAVFWHPVECLSGSSWLLLHTGFMTHWWYHLHCFPLLFHNITPSITKSTDWECVYVCVCGSVHTCSFPLFQLCREIHVYIFFQEDRSQTLWGQASDSFQYNILRNEAAIR